MSQKQDYYKLLGITKGAQETEIKAAYRKAALKYHPDRNPGDKAAEEKFKELNEAYEVLGDSKKRQMYDQFGHAGVNGAQGGGASGFGGGGFSGFGGGFDADIFGDMFSDIFTGGSNRRTERNRGPQQGDDLQYQVNVNLSEVAFGTEKTIKINHTEKCNICNGSGAKKGSSPQTCPDCNGAGQVKFSRGFFSTVQTCPRCHGQGEVITNPCTKCSGKGTQNQAKNLKMKIPAGADTGVTLRLRGEGNAGMKGGQSGDLFVILNVINDTEFERRDANLYSQQNISFTQAAMGTEIGVPTIERKMAKMKIPAATQTETVFRLKDKGLPIMGTKRNGDQMVKVKIKVPKKFTKEQKSALITFAKTMGEEIDESRGKEGFIKKIFLK
ncbi:MAG: molecular chaperone DnaJ [bacterium]|nr:molecular chaperone DnaJ [bacterium]